MTHIPLFTRGGRIIPVRVKSRMTTTEIRERDLELIVALGRDGTAEGNLYLDDGESLEQDGTSEMNFEFRNGALSVAGTFEYNTSARMKAITIIRPEAGGGRVGRGGFGLEPRLRLTSRFTELAGLKFALMRIREL